MSRIASRRRTDGPPTVADGALAIREVDSEALLATLPHPIMVIDANNHITFANAAAEAFFSMGIERMVFKPAAIFVNSDESSLALE